MNHTLVITRKRAEAPDFSLEHAGTWFEGPNRHARVWSGLLALLLALLLIATPLFRAYASEEPVVEEPVVEEVVEAAEEVVPDEPAPVIEQEEVSEVEAPLEESPETEAGVVIPPAPEVATTTDTGSSSDTSTSTDALPVIAEIDAVGTTTATTSASSTPPHTTDTTVGGGVEETPTTPAVPEPDVTTPTDVMDEATTTPEADEAEATTTPQGDVVNAVTNDENRFSFGINECVAVGDGSFYCTESGSRVALPADGVFAAVDEEGDKEIYLRTNGREEALTHNRTDDDAPFYDPVSERVVWHGVVNDRFQIFSYDPNSQEILQLTHASYNNMQASAYADITLWQAWIGNDWEIMMDDEGELTQLTDNEVHDVMPRIRGDYVLWQSFEGDAWRVKVLDRTTGMIDTIEGDAGASAENPRFVLVYDSKKENGDVETVGYDFDSKTVIPLASTPVPVKERVPEPEESGEERALLQQQTSRTEVRSEEGGAGGDGEGNGDDDVASSTSNGVSTSSSYTDEQDVAASSSPAHTGFDLIIPEMSSAQSADAQDEVASSSVIRDNGNQ